MGASEQRSAKQQHEVAVHRKRSVVVVHDVPEAQRLAAFKVDSLTSPWSFGQI
jgi:hypothetical protein